MLNALEIYNRINSHEYISSLVGTQEDVFLDFKTSESQDGRATIDDKFNFCKALSGFAHQEGGVIVWGLNCKRDAITGADRVIAEQPILNINKFQESLFDYYAYATEPVVEGFLNKIIYFNNDSSEDKGFLVHYIPKSYSVHRVLSSKDRILFYKRYGWSFRPVENTAEIRSLFFRKFAPQLEVSCKIEKPNANDILIYFSLKNRGPVSAKYISVYILPLPGFRYYDGGGGDRWNSWTEVLNGDGSRTFNFENGFVLHPEQETKVFQSYSHFTHDSNVKKPDSLEYVIYAENMEPLKENKNLQ